MTLREPQTHEIIEDVAHLKSEIGVLYTSGRNEDVISKLIKKNNLHFEPLFTAPLHVFISTKNPLATNEHMTVGVLTRKGIALSRYAASYVEALKNHIR